MLRSPDDLIAAGLAPRERRAELARIATRYALSLTTDVVELIDPADPRDPIARQYLPDAAELETQPHETADPTGDDAWSPVEGIVHRYPDRVLLKPVHVCRVYCRFCFRREIVRTERLRRQRKEHLVRDLRIQKRRDDFCRLACAERLMLAACQLFDHLPNGERRVFDDLDIAWSKL